MGYRTIEIAWKPRSHKEWATFTACRMEAARLWGDLVERHYRIRRLQLRWPTKERWQKWAKGRYKGLHSQSVQQIIADFVEAVEATRQLRKKGHDEARYPYHKPRYKGVIYTNQAALLRDGRLTLPNGSAGPLSIRIPGRIVLEGRLMEVRLDFGRVMLVCQVEDVVRPQGAIIGVDLGVNTLIAATDGKRAVLVSGREAKASVQWRNKRLASMQTRQSALTKGSRRHKRTQRRKYRMLAKAHRRMTDILHKATRHVAGAFPNAKCYVGEPFNDAAQKLGRMQAQQVSSASNARIIRMLDYKTSGAIQVDEAYSSQTCPNCGTRRKAKRTYTCRECGITAPRDVIGAANILAIGKHGCLQTGCGMPQSIQFVYPQKYPGLPQVVRHDTAQVASSNVRSPRLKTGECHQPPYRSSSQGSPRI